MSERKEIPTEVLDLLIFMCETWDSIDKFVYFNCSGDTLMTYPVIQGTSNQMNIRKIGQQDYDVKNLKKAVEWMIEGKRT